jgi:hypothetical protein
MGFILIIDPCFWAKIGFELGLNWVCLGLFLALFLSRSSFLGEKWGDLGSFCIIC